MKLWLLTWDATINICSPKSIALQIKQVSWSWACWGEWSLYLELQGRRSRPVGTAAFQLEEIQTAFKENSEWQTNMKQNLISRTQNSSKKNSLSKIPCFYKTHSVCMCACMRARVWFLWLWYSRPLNYQTSNFAITFSVSFLHAYSVVKSISKL